jgi:prefoldin beta subunit
LKNYTLELPLVMSGASTAVDEKIKKYQDLQGDISKLFQQKTTFLSQFNENTLVKGELDLLEEGTSVYKLVGPALMAVELDESKSNVQKRLEFIETELKKLDNAIAAKQGEQAAIGEEVQKMQREMQAETVSSVKELLGN